MIEMELVGSSGAHALDVRMADPGLIFSNALLECGIGYLRARIEQVDV